MCTGVDLGGRGTVSLKTEVGDGPCIRPPNILRSTVIGCTYDLTKQNISRRRLLVKKRVIHVIYQISYSRDRQKTGKIETMTKKGSSTNPAPSLRPWLRVAYKYLLFRSVGTTSGPRATSGPRRVAKWPAMSNRKKLLLELSQTLRLQWGTQSSYI